jgi:hypothetical protein
MTVTLHPVTSSITPSMQVSNAPLRVMLHRAFWAASPDAAAPQRNYCAAVTLPSQSSIQFNGCESHMATRAAKSNSSADELEGLMSDALRKFLSEIEERPIIMLGIAAGVGFLLGLANRR